MKIHGDEAVSQFRTYVEEPGLICGHNDVLVGNRERVRHIILSSFGDTDEWITHQPKLYFHISNTFWSSFTGLLREYCCKCSPTSFVGR